MHKDAVYLNITAVSIQLLIIYDTSELQCTQLTAAQRWIINIRAAIQTNNYNE